MCLMSTLAEIRSLSSEEFEELWLAPAKTEPLCGVYEGHVLGRIDNDGARRPFWEWSQRIAFEWIPFGIDFDRGLWFFFSPRVAMGRFEARSQRSRWRETDAFGLHYETSRFPNVVRDVLYDEVKPLDDRLLMGLGGVNAERGEGDHFYFALTRVE
jgi:hypothetical protein